MLYEYVYRGQSAEQIIERFPTLELQQIYATILYYLHNREMVEAYLLGGLDFSRKMREKQTEMPSPAVSRLLKLKAEKSLSTV